MKSSKLALFGGKPAFAKKLEPYLSLGKEERRAVGRAMASHELSGFLGRGEDRFWGGPFVRKLEKDFAGYFGVKHAVSFNSATTALQAAVAALGIGPGDEVITSPFTMSATPASVLLNGAVPVFADVHKNTYCLDPISVEQNITKRTKAIIVVNLFGGGAHYSALAKIAKKHNLKIIEDNAQSPGGTYKGRYLGTLGDIGVLSFNVHKVIQSGEGGLILTNNDRYAYRAALVRNHGEVAVDDFWSEPSRREYIVGSNYRLTELQAALMIEQIKKLERFNAARIDLADHLSKALARFSWLRSARVLPRSRHVYYLYPFTFFEEKAGFSRSLFVEAMRHEGFLIEEGYQKPLYLLPIYQKKRIYERSSFPFSGSTVCYDKGICPTAERLYERELCVTNLCRPPSTRATVDSFVRALQKIDDARRELQQYEKGTRDN